MPSLQPVRRCRDALSKLITAQRTAAGIRPAPAGRPAPRRGVGAGGPPRDLGRHVRYPAQRASRPMGRDRRGLGRPSGPADRNDDRSRATWNSSCGRRRWCRPGRSGPSPAGRPSPLLRSWRARCSWWTAWTGTAVVPGGSRRDGHRIPRTAPAVNAGDRVDVMASPPRSGRTRRTPFGAEPTEGRRPLPVEPAAAGGGGDAMVLEGGAPDATSLTVAVADQDIAATAAALLDGPVASWSGASPPLTDPPRVRSPQAPDTATPSMRIDAAPEPDGSHSKSSPTATTSVRSRCSVDAIVSSCTGSASCAAPDHHPVGAHREVTGGRVHPRVQTRERLDGQAELDAGEQLRRRSRPPVPSPAAADRARAARAVPRTADAVDARAARRAVRRVVQEPVDALRPRSADCGRVASPSPSNSSAPSDSERVGSSTRPTHSAAITLAESVGERRAPLLHRLGRQHPGDDAEQGDGQPRLEEHRHATPTPAWSHRAASWPARPPRAPTRSRSSSDGMRAASEPHPIWVSSPARASGWVPSEQLVPSLAAADAGSRDQGRLAPAVAVGGGAGRRHPGVGARHPALQLQRQFRPCPRRAGRSPRRTTEPGGHRHAVVGCQAVVLIRFGEAAVVPGLGQGVLPTRRRPRSPQWANPTLPSRITRMPAPVEPDEVSDSTSPAWTRTDVEAPRLDHHLDLLVRDRGPDQSIRDLEQVRHGPDPRRGRSSSSTSS